MTESKNWLVKFETPAFLGNSEQQGQWRTPPFKALLREWWRISRLKALEYDFRRLRDEENKLFGTAADGPEKKSQKSNARLRLSCWDDGTCRDVKTRLNPYRVDSGGHPANPGIYLGYGPVQQDVQRAAIEPEPGPSRVTLSVGIEGGGDALDEAIRLAHWFGTMGSRARNGWGSVSFTPSPDNPLRVNWLGDFSKLTAAKLRDYLRPWRECLNNDWPQAIGEDDEGQPLVWQTTPENTWIEWEAVIQELAKIRIAINKVIPPASDARTPKSRNLLSYPVTNLEVYDWEKHREHNETIPQVRIPSQLRFKVVRIGNQLVGQIVHLPCRVPDHEINRIHASTAGIIAQEIDLWDKVHKKLNDKTLNLVRLI